MSEVLIKFITSFVDKARQDRYLTLMQNTKRRSDMLWGLLHDGRHLDHSKFKRIPLKKIHLLEGILRKAGAKGAAYIMAPSDELDGKEAELSTCLERFLGKAEDVAIYLSAPNIGYYENHEGEIYVFSGKP